MKKEIIIERWESFTEFRGQLFKVDLEKLAEEYNEPSILEMNEEELSEYLDEEIADLYDENCNGAIQTYLSVVNQSDPDLETSYFMNKKEANEGISWRGFYRGDPDDWNTMDWKTKNERIDTLKEELEKEKAN